MTRKIAPTRGAMRRIKASMSLAKKGRDLLDQKRKILMVELMGHIEEVGKIQEEMKIIFASGYESLQTAHIVMGIRRVESVANSVPIQDNFIVRLHSVMGVEIPQVDPISPDAPPVYSFGSTSPTLDDAYVHARKVLALIARLAEVHTSVTRLAVQIRKTVRRVNALEKVTIPFQKKTIKEISDILDENEREDLVRMKLSKRNQA
ncbi:MAG: V-type ATP synthase subunit D [Synergistaceae bacterium]|nr:V-type ATP synthase subunit D [Synergistaceae bacterium]